MLKATGKIVIATFCLILFLSQLDGINAFVSEAKTAAKIVDKALEVCKVSKNEIQNFAKLDYKGLMQALSKYADEPKKIETIIVAVAREKKIISAAEADEVFKNLAEVKNFRNVVKLLCSESKAQINGAMYELQVANSASKNGFKVMEFRQKFLGDPNKMFTDIDLILESKNGKTIIMECKSYAGITSDMVHADAQTLVHYANQNKNCVKVFAFAEEPSELTKKILQERCGCIVLFGDPDSQILALSLMI
jgi:hypothetical protein